MIELEFITRKRYLGPRYDVRKLILDDTVTEYHDDIIKYIKLKISNGLAETQILFEDGEYEMQEAVDVIVWLKADGTLELNGSADNAVRFSDLKTAFDQLKSDFDLHNHPTAPVGPVSTPSTAPSTADIDPAKVDEVKLP